jgi:outer membrane protein OmpA-like peptidoglycan-associated protein
MPACQSSLPIRIAAALGAAALLNYAGAPTGHAQSLADRLKSVQSGDADSKPQVGPPLVPFRPIDATMSSIEIPLAKGLLVVAARSTPDGDYEWYSAVQDATTSQFKLQISFSDKRAHGAAAGTSGNDPANKGTKCQLIVDSVDFVSARSTRTWACQDPVEHYPGITQIALSSDVLNGLLKGEAVQFYFPARPGEDTAEAVENIQRMLHGQALQKPAVSDHAGLPSYSCVMHRVGATDVMVPVLVNDQPVRLPALHAATTCKGLEGKDVASSDYYLLDQPSNPVLLVEEDKALSLRITQVIKISFPPGAQKPGQKAAPAPDKPKAVSSMERALSDNKPVQVYGIYFDFNSAEIRPESEQVLGEIAGIMQKNPDWKLSLSGNTDNVGGDKFNLALSQQRAAAVKDALVTRYKIAPDRLQTAGFGASSPIDSNDTFEGRARNRRVELRRL